jgi:hypothetical protein
MLWYLLVKLSRIAPILFSMVEFTVTILLMGKIFHKFTIYLQKLWSSRAEGATMMCFGTIEYI